MKSQNVGLNNKTNIIKVGVNVDPDTNKCLAPLDNTNVLVLYCIT